MLRMSRTVDIHREKGKVGDLFAGGNHLAHNRQFQRRQEKSRPPEDIARLPEVYSLPPLRDDEKARLGGSMHLGRSGVVPALKTFRACTFVDRIHTTHRVELLRLIPISLRLRDSWDCLRNAPSLVLEHLSESTPLSTA